MPYFFRIYLRTAALCSSSVWLNWLKPVPSILETNYRYFSVEGCAADSSAALPGSAIGVGVRPARV